MIFTFLLFSLIFVEKSRSDTTCRAYFECVRVKSEILKSCDNSRTDENCWRRMEADWRMIANFEKILDGEMTKCVEEGLRNVTGQLSDEKTRFCAPYLQRIDFSRNEQCPMKIGKISNQCDALKSCCDPASRCEQNAMYTETGRTLMGLKEEVNIKMAECAQKPLPERAPSKKSRILKSPPFSLCLDYLQCQKDAHHLQLACFDPISIDDPFCSSQFAGDIRKLRQKRVEAFDYLDKCVPRANVTREFATAEPRVCRAKALRLVGGKGATQNCHLDVSQKRKECAMLRDCCVQADVCERSALYAVISDEYLLRRTELRKDLENCQSNKNNI